MASFAMAFERRRKLIPTVICVEAGSRRSCRPLNVRFALDSVAKLFWAPERATLIQDQSPLGNVDSEMCSSRFDYCWLANRPGVLQHYLPIGDICSAANCSLFDHLVGAGKQCWRDL